MMKLCNDNRKRGGKQGHSQRSDARQRSARRDGCGDSDQGPWSSISPV